MNNSRNLQVTPELARDGSTTVRIGERYLHSRYNPEREASNFAKQIPDCSQAAIIFVIGAALSSVAEAILDHAPHVGVIISLEPGAECVDPPSKDPRCTRLPIGNLSPGQIRRVVRSRVKPWELGRVHVVVWPAAESIIPEWTSAVGSRMVEAMQDVRSEMATIAVFGRRWLHNALYGALSWNYRYTVSPHHTPLMIATSGPSLDRMQPTDIQDGRGIIATSSSLRWFRHHKVPVKLVVHTDGGVWASRYLVDAPNDAIISLPIRSARLGVSHPMPMRTGWIGEELAIDAQSWPLLPEQPTVGASVLALAARVTTGDLYVAGLDLCSRDLLGHAAPHRNDQFFRTRCNRLYPEVHQRAERLWHRGERMEQRWDTGEIGWQDPAMTTYQPVLEDMLQQLRPRQLHRLSGASPVLKHLGTLHRKGPLPQREELSFVRHERPSRSERVRRATLTLRQWEETLRSAPEPSGLHDPVFGELALHLAPAELTQWAGKSASWDAVTSAAVHHLQTMRRRAGRE